MSPRYLLWVVGIALGSLGAQASTDRSYIPTSDALVLERLPRALVVSRESLGQLRSGLAASPRDPVIAGQLAAQLVRIGNSSADPRYFGHARAILAPWKDRTDVPTSMLLLRAKLHEKAHDYDKATIDLEHLLRRYPAHQQASIELANIHRVRGHYDAALAICEELERSSGPTPATVCRIPVLAVTGQARYATRLLDELYAGADTASTRSLWPTIMRATIADALGDSTKAEHAFAAAMRLDPGNPYLLRAYADFLLDRQRNSEVVEVLRPHVANNGILLRATIAARRSGDDALARRWQSELAARFDAIRQRGDDPHARYESRYALEIEQNADRALRLALANWQRQKETRDTRNLLEAALAAGDSATIARVRDFLTLNGTEDRVLLALSNQR